MILFAKGWNLYVEIRVPFLYSEKALNKSYLNYDDFPSRYCIRPIERKFN